jgi:hypothetical protein
MHPNFTRLLLKSSGGENGRMTDAWMIDELAYAGPEHLDANFVEGFDRKPGYPDPGEDLARLEA